MTRRARWIWSGFVVAALGLLMLVGSRSFASLGEDPDIKPEVQKIADALKKGDKAAAETMAKKLIMNKDFEFPMWEAMLGMKPRESKQKGWGVGKKGEFPEELDGIEKLVQEISKNGLKKEDLTKHKDALLEMAYRINAISEVAKLHKEKKMQPLWNTLAKNMNEMSKDLISAVEAGKAEDINKLTAKLDANCNQCHEKFRD